jgi:hypothetical protein
VPRSSLIAGSRIMTAEVLALTTSADTHAAKSTPRPGERPAAVVGLGSAISC